MIPSDVVINAAAAHTTRAALSTTLVRTVCSRSPTSTPLSAQCCFTLPSSQDTSCGPPPHPFLATLKHSGAYITASCGHLFLCVHGADACYSIVDPTTGLRVPLRLPPPLTSLDDRVYLESIAFYCTAAMNDFTVVYLTRQCSGHLVTHWLTSTLSRWRSNPTEAWRPPARRRHGLCRQHLLLDACPRRRRSMPVAHTTQAVHYPRVQHQ